MINITIAFALVREGAGKVKIIEVDFIEYHNLQGPEFIIPDSQGFRETVKF